MLSALVLLSLGATCWYANIKVLEPFFNVERVVDSQLHLQELALLATLPLAILLVSIEPIYGLIIIIYCIFCKKTLIQLSNLCLRAIKLPVHFVDVLFCDFLTSYAKVFADMTTIPQLKPFVTWYL